MDDVYLEFKRRMGSFQIRIQNFRSQYEPGTGIRRGFEVVAWGCSATPRRGSPIQRHHRSCCFRSQTVPPPNELANWQAFPNAPSFRNPWLRLWPTVFSPDVTKEFWLVYDFGAAFDAAIMKAEDVSASSTMAATTTSAALILIGPLCGKLCHPELTANFNFPACLAATKVAAYSCPH